MLASMLLLAQMTAAQPDYAGVRFKEEVRFPVWKKEVAFRDGCVFERGALFNGFEKDVTFEARFLDEVIFSKKFGGDAYFFGTHFMAKSLFQSVDFTGETFFSAVHFHRYGGFSDVRFHGPAHFQRVGGKHLEFATAGSTTTFEREASFAGATIEHLRFDGVTFAGPADFSEATFERFAVENSRFALEPNFTDTHFAGPVSFARSTFEQGLDLRFADLSGATWISFEKVRVDPRELLVSWDQLRRRGAHALSVERRTNESWEQWFLRLAASDQLVAARGP